MEGWKYIKLGDIIHVKHGYGFKGKYFVEEPNHNLLLTPGNFAIGGGFKYDKMKYYDGPINDEFVLSAGDVIVTMTDLSMKADTLGYSAKIPNNPENTYLHNQRLGLVSLKTNEFDLDYIYWLLRTYNYQKYIAGSSSGATVKHTSPKKIYSAKLLVPESKVTQKRIADILSAYDDLIENNLKRIKLLEQAAQNIYKEWFVNMRFPGHENTPINEETGLPEGWEKMTLSDFIEFKNGKSLKDKESSETYIVYGSNGVIGKSSFYNREDAIIIGRVGAYCGSINHCKNKFWATDNTITAKAISSKSTNIFCKLLLKNLNLRRFAGGAAQPLLTQRTITGLTVPLPSFILIKKFTLTADLIKKQSDNLSNLNHSLKSARDILLPRLMNRTIEV